MAGGDTAPLECRQITRWRWCYKEAGHTDAHWNVPPKGEAEVSVA